DGAVKGLRIGVVSEMGGDKTGGDRTGGARTGASGATGGFQPGVLQRFHEALELLEKQGAELVEVSAPSFEYAISAYYLILPAEASSNLAKFDSVRFGLRTEVPGGTIEDVMAAT